MSWLLWILLGPVAFSVLHRIESWPRAPWMGWVPLILCGPLLWLVMLLCRVQAAQVSYEQRTTQHHSAPLKWYNGITDGNGNRKQTNGSTMIHAREDYNRIQDPAGLIPEDEPVFLLRAQDELACKAVAYYAELCKQSQALPVALKAQEHAERMAAWPKKKIPDLKTGLPGFE